jgi:hypothetical protein
MLIISVVISIGCAQSSSRVISTIQQETIDTLTPTPSPVPTEIPTPSPLPTPIPTPKIVPGSPLSLGGVSFAETLSQLDIMELAKIVLVGLGLMWVIVILVYIDKEFVNRGQK